MATKKIPNPKENHPSMHQENRHRTTTVSLSLKTYGTEAQRNLTIRKLEHDLKIMGYDIKLSTIRTLSVE